jgi:hypothetical protein
MEVLKVLNMAGIPAEFQNIIGIDYTNNKPY